MSLSILILTLDEEQNLEGCLDSIAWCDDIVILDSKSHDRTQAIARSRGARVFERAFDDYASQRNFGLREIPYRYDWVLMLDADERVPDDLRDEMLRLTRTAPRSLALVRMRRRDYLFGTWIRRSSGYPTWFGRLARVGRVWVDRPINEQYHADGDIGELHAHLEHYPFNKGFAAWMEKHNRYSTMEASILASRSPVRGTLSAMLVSDPDARRRATKRWLYSLPLRPLVVFAGLYFVKGGILEGRAGLTFSLLRAWYEYFIDCKTAELRRRAEGLPV